MTIMVYIENQDAAGRTIEVVEVAINKDTGQRAEAIKTRMASGESRTFYTHLLRDLIVREVEP